MNLPTDKATAPDSPTSLAATAAKLVAARRQAVALNSFPGDIPTDLDVAYRIQECAIDLWAGQKIGGWKVGRIPPDLEDRFGIDRLAGPIFSHAILATESDDALDMPIIVNGFAAIEAEFVAVIGKDAPKEKTEWSRDESLDMIADLRIGLEIASSPMPDINDLGPTVVVSDQGNNLGLVVGPSVRDWRARALDTMHCRSIVDGEQVGAGGAFTLTGGFLRSVQFILGLNANRGMPLRSGDLIATGQTTGIHDVVAGQTACADFGTDGVITVNLTAAVAED